MAIDGDDLWLWGEKPIELGNSWFSAKSIEVERLLCLIKVKHSLYAGDHHVLPSTIKLLILIFEYNKQSECKW